jgi:hypothetical protein
MELLQETWRLTETKQSTAGDSYRNNDEPVHIATGLKHVYSICSRRRVDRLKESPKRVPNVLQEQKKQQRQHP